MIMIVYNQHLRNTVIIRLISKLQYHFVHLIKTRIFLSIKNERRHLSIFALCPFEGLIVKVFEGR